MQKSKLYRVVTFQNITAGLPNDYWIFLLSVVLVVGYALGLFFKSEYVGLGVAAVLGGILYLYGLIKALRDPNFFDVIYTNITKTSSSKHYEP
jgi:type IV secretory pathway VirB3-like protein